MENKFVTANEKKTIHNLDSAIKALDSAGQESLLEAAKALLVLQTLNLRVTELEKTA